MRMIAATLKDAYHVYKTLKDYSYDVGSLMPTEKDYVGLAKTLSDERYRFLLLMHSKKTVGMIWGREEDEGFLICGKFLKRAYRGKFKFTRELALAKLEITKGYGTVKERVPATRDLKKRRPAYHII